MKTHVRLTAPLCCALITLLCVNLPIFAQSASFSPLLTCADTHCEYEVSYLGDPPYPEHDCLNGVTHNKEDRNNDGRPDGCLKDGGLDVNDCFHASEAPKGSWSCIGPKCCADYGGQLYCVGSSIASTSGRASILCVDPSTNQAKWKLVGLDNCGHSLWAAKSGVYCFIDSNGDGGMNTGETVTGRANCSTVQW